MNRSNRCFNVWVIWNSTGQKPAAGEILQDHQKGRKKVRDGSHNYSICAGIRGGGDRT